jgi:hypothetical protein
MVMAVTFESFGNSVRSFLLRMSETATAAFTSWARGNGETYGWIANQAARLVLKTVETFELPVLPLETIEQMQHIEETTRGIPLANPEEEPKPAHLVSMFREQAEKWAISAMVIAQDGLAAAQREDLPDMQRRRMAELSRFAAKVGMAVARALGMREAVRRFQQVDDEARRVKRAVRVKRPPKPISRPAGQRLAELAETRPGIIPGSKEREERRAKRRVRVYRGEPFEE